MSSNTENEMDHDTTGKSENLLSDPIIIDENTYDFRGINDLRNQNPFRVITGNININSIRNKFEPLVSCIAKGEGFCSISERIYLLKKYLLKKVIFDESFEGVFIEKNLRSKKWLLGYSYNSQWDNVTPHLRNISTALDKLSTGYGNVMLLLK